MKKIKLILNESLISNKDSDIIEDTTVAQKPEYQITDITVIPDETYYPTIQAILIDLDEANKLKESEDNKLDINILSETVNQKTGYSNSLFEFESSNHTITLSLVLQETDRRGIYKVEAYTTRGVKVFESNTYRPKYVIESYLNSLANEYLVDKPLKESLNEAEERNPFGNSDKIEIVKTIDFNNGTGFIGYDKDNWAYHSAYWADNSDTWNTSSGPFRTAEEAEQDLRNDYGNEDTPTDEKTTEEDYSATEFANGEKLTNEVLELNIDYSEWNEASPEEREAMVKPELQRFLSKHKNEFDKNPKLFDLVQYNLTDKNFHTEAKVLKDLYRGGN